MLLPGFNNFNDEKSKAATAGVLPAASNQ